MLALSSSHVAETARMLSLKSARPEFRPEDYLEPEERSCLAEILVAGGGCRVRALDPADPLTPDPNFQVSLAALVALEYPGSMFTSS